MDAGQAIAVASRAAEHPGDPRRDRAPPVGTDDEIAPRLRAVHPPHPRKGVGAVVAELIEPKASTEIGDLDDDRIRGQIEHPEAVDHVLVRTGNDGRPRPDDVGEHRQAVDRSDRDPAAPPRGRHALQRRAALVEVDQRPAPHVGLLGGAAEFLEPDAIGHGAVRERAPGDRRGSEGTRPAEDQRKRDQCQKDGSRQSERHRCRHDRSPREGGWSAAAGRKSPPRQQRSRRHEPIPLIRHPFPLGTEADLSTSEPFYASGDWRRPPYQPRRKTGWRGHDTWSVGRAPVRPRAGGHRGAAARDGEAAGWLRQRPRRPRYQPHT